VPGEVLQFGASLLAVLALVAFTWLLGFRQPARLSSADEARDLLRLAPGGFEPVDIALAADGAAAVARDAHGRLCALVPHGSRFVARPVLPGHATRRDRNTLILRLEDRRVTIDLGHQAADWIGADSAVN
jgi:hypothetical protein